MYSNKNDCHRVRKITYERTYNHGQDAYKYHPFTRHLKSFFLFAVCSIIVYLFIIIYLFHGNVNFLNYGSKICIINVISKQTE